MEELKDKKDVDIMILGAPNQKMQNELEKEECVKEVVTFGSSMQFVREELEEPNQLFDLTITGFTKLTESSHIELEMLGALYQKVVSVLKPLGKLIIISSA